MSENNLYEQIVVRGKNANRQTPLAPKTYRGISTVNPESRSFEIYDLALIKQDLINHFHIRQGEKLENPEFGTIIWDTLFEPLTDSLRNAIAEDVERIINYDPRITADEINIVQYENGIRLECRLTYLNYNISEQITLNFDRNNGLIS